jgi:hypothetical protein
LILYKKIQICIACVAVWAGSGCTMMSLERHTVAQTDSAMDVRYREILDNLALIANNPSALPSYATIFSGSASVQDTGQLISTTTLPYYTVGSEALNPSVTRQITENWVLDPLLDPERMEAIRAACQWVIGGPEYVFKDSMSLLIRPDQAPKGPDRHFAVADQLARLSAGWLSVGKHTDVPPRALYKAHCGQTWVWVTPEGMKGLADFTLILQHIARIQINSGTLFNLPPVFTPIVFATADSKSTDRNQTTVQVVVDQSGRLVTDFPYFKVRIDDTRADSNLISILSSSGLSTVPH